MQVLNFLLDKICKHLTYHTPFYHYPSQSYQLSKTVWFFGPPCNLVWWCSAAGKVAGLTHAMHFRLNSEQIYSSEAYVKEMNNSFISVRVRDTLPLLYLLLNMLQYFTQWHNIQLQQRLTHSPYKLSLEHSLKHDIVSIVGISDSIGTSQQHLKRHIWNELT